MKGVCYAIWAALGIVLIGVVILVYIDLHPLLAQANEATRQYASLGNTVERKVAPIELKPIVDNVAKATKSVANAASKWEKASDAQIENVNKTGEDSRRVIAHLDRILTNQVVPTFDNLKATSAELPEAVKATTAVLQSSKLPMDDLHQLLTDREKGMPALLDESIGTMAEMHSAAGNFETFSERWTHPASALKQWFFGLLDVTFKAKSLSK